MDKRRLWWTLGMYCQRGANARGAYLRKKEILGGVGDYVRYQPRMIPLYPKLIKLHNNITIAAGVRLITHDASYGVLNRCGKDKKYPEKVGCIEIMDNVFIGYGATILPNVRIGNNVIVGANSTVTKDLPSNGVYVGSPAKCIGTFEDFCRRLEMKDGKVDYPTVAKNTLITDEEIKNAWQIFEKERQPEK